MSLPPRYHLHDAAPTPERFVALRRAAGLSPRTVEGARRGLPRSLAAVSISLDGQTVAMGRVVGDGVLNFEIVDVAVDPTHQRRGLGRAIMIELMSRVHAMATPGACISLIADRGAERLYESFGFVPCMPGAQGMELFVPITTDDEAQR